MKSRQSTVAAMSLALFLSLAQFSTPAHAACVGPMLRLTPSEKVESIAKDGVSLQTFASLPPVERASASQKVSLIGISFYETCNDVGFNGPPPPKQPAKKIKVFFKQGSRKIHIGTVDAAKDFSFIFSVNIPEDAEAGPAEVVAERFSGDRVSAVPVTVTK